MPSVSSLLLASRQCEIAELEELARTNERVAAAARLIHALQRERGTSSVFLASHGTRFGAQRARRLTESEQAASDVRRQLQALASERRLRGGSRLFIRAAQVLHGLEGLPALRERIGRQALAAREASAAYTRLLAGLLALVFEGADGATDAPVARVLVALFNYMQGKELAGQERALGAGVFAAGFIDTAGQQQWAQLIEAQQDCLQAFRAFADAELLRTEQASRDPAVLAELERLRRIGGSIRRELDPELSPHWYEWASRRIDAMRAVEDALARRLRELCDARLAQARSELRDPRALLQLPAGAPAELPAPCGPRPERSMLLLLQEQSRRLEAMAEELASVRAALSERKLVERAKGLLMAHRNMTEEDAYRALRQLAMNQNRRLADVAEAVLSLAPVLPQAAG